VKCPIKPSVVFFNEAMPGEFKRAAQSPALQHVDLLLILGTSLKVGPFNQIPYKLPETAP
jgi:NAD-dependent SIR2 family protein deacetylase